MKETSPDSQSFPDRISSWAKTHAHGSPFTPGTRRSPTLNSTTTNNVSPTDTTAIPPFPSSDRNGFSRSSNPTNNGAFDTTATSPHTASPSQAEGQGTVINPAADATTSEPKPKKNVAIRFYLTGKEILLSSWINVLLVFVPVGIAADAANLNPTIVFAMNAVAIVPLAGLLSHATESVAKRLGDTVGALMNVTFGNAVELIIFIALVKNEIRIVQASLLGSILSNLLLILGMCFLIGGLRFREQIYNSTVTQMSACLLSLSVMSLLLPTAFHASFTDTTKADTAVLQVSRGTSIILLLVYGMYLLFQLKSHAYMYESTPQHIIDEESAPGPVAAWMDSSSDDSDSSSSDESDASSGSNTTAKRFRRVMRGGRRRRKSSSGSKDTAEIANITHSPSLRNGSITEVVSDTVVEEPSQSSEPAFGHRFGALDNGESVADNRPVVEKSNSFSKHSENGSKKERKYRKKQQKKEKKARKAAEAEFVEKEATSSATEKPTDLMNEPRRVDFAIQNDLEAQNQDALMAKRPFTIRGLSIRPAIPKTFSQNVFTTSTPSGSPHLRGVNTPPQPQGPIPRIRYGIRRTNSLPDRLGQTILVPNRVQSTAVQSSNPGTVVVPAVNEVEDEENISRTTAIVLLLISTGLVALCAEFMVDSINEVVSTTGISEAFVGLIILPIVGNAAEHVTAVTVASKNKMDLAIGVAVGSSIQIALFVTPLVILLGWIMDKDMSLYFTLFETVSLFVSAFIVNFLVLDGRSNYLEGALLCAAYVIIAVAAYFYPDNTDASVLGGNSEAAVALVSRMVGWSS